MCAQPNSTIYNEREVKLDTVYRYDHVPKSAQHMKVETRHVKTGRTIHKNQPDIIIRHNEKATFMLVYMALPL